MPSQTQVNRTMWPGQEVTPGGHLDELTAHAISESLPGQSRSNRLSQCQHLPPATGHSPNAAAALLRKVKASMCTSGSLNRGLASSRAKGTSRKPAEQGAM